MEDKQNDINLAAEDHMTVITYTQIRHTEESILFLRHLVDIQLSQTDPHNEPERHKSLGSLALRMRKLWYVCNDCEEDYHFIETFLDRKA
jgi:hypothetical protein